MSWLSNFVRPKIQALVSRDVPENLWVKCPACAQMIFHRELDANQKVCTHCGHHMRIGARDRLAALFDDGEFTEIEPPETVVDPLRFRDRKRYSERLRDAQAKTGTGSSRTDALIVAHGQMGGMPTVIAVFDFSFMGGSMGIAVGETLVAAAKLAVLQQGPLIVVPASGGARMQEGILSLMQMPRTIVAIDEVKEAGLPYVVLLTDPTTGGVSASFAMLGDVQIAEPGAQIGFAGKRVIEDTIREQLPAEFQTAEYLLDHGMLDMVVPRQELRETLIRLFAHLMRPNPPADVIALPTERRSPATGAPAANGASSGTGKSPKATAQPESAKKPSDPEQPAKPSGESAPESSKPSPASGKPEERS